MPTIVRVPKPKKLSGHSPSDAVTLRSTKGRLSPHFRVEELACPCENCDRVVVHWALIELLQHIRWRIGRPVIVTSGFRCAAHNQQVGGASASRHLTGLAADLQCNTLSPKEVADVAKRCGAGGIGVYPRHTHVDVGEEGRWRGDYD